MPQFVLLRHACPPSYGKPSHWDLLLENGQVLLAWSLLDLPRAWVVALGSRTHAEVDLGAGSECVAAVPLAPHRLKYLDFEGPLSNGRGSVRRCDRGTYVTLAEDQGTWRFALTGALLNGAATLQCDLEAWRLECVDAEREAPWGKPRAS